MSLMHGISTDVFNFYQLNRQTGLSASAGCLLVRFSLMTIQYFLYHQGFGERWLQVTATLRSNSDHWYR